MRPPGAVTNSDDRALLESWNRTETDYPLGTPLPDFIEAQVARTPDAVAVSSGSTALTYAELNRRSNQLAHHLIAQGVGPDVLVGICIERSLEMVIGLLGILKAGGAYVPFDPDYPRERLAFMIDDSRAAVLLTASSLRDRIPDVGARRIELDTDRATLEGFSPENPVRQLSPTHLAYMIYTSGSTGKPKGAMNTQAGIVNRLLWMQDAYLLTPDDRVLQKTPFSFDVSVWEFFWPLMTGARLVMAEPGGHKNPDYLVRTIAKEGITTLHFVPSMLSAFNGAEGLESLTSLRHVMCSGEALQAEQVNRFFKRVRGARLHNLYGPTEAAVDVTFWECERGAPGDIIPIGRPIANIWIRILDESLNEVAVGEPGELHIGGVGLARGYWNRPELTAEKFIRDPFAKREGDRLYKTGDLARYRPDGNIEYLGRLDFQVKLRGLRIELGEIEAALLKHPGIKEAVVIATDGAFAEKRLLAFLVATGTTPPRTNELREYLLRGLPDYMVPSAFIFLAELPLSPNGKVDRKALGRGRLPRPDLDQPFIAPKRPLEKVMASIWADLLNLERVGVRDNFFDLGGNSLLAVEVFGAFAARGGGTIPVVKIFQYPSVHALVSFLEEKSPGAKDLDLEVARVAEQRRSMSGGERSHDVAIIGLSGRFPGARGTDELWENLVRGVESVTFFSKEELGPGLDPEITNSPNYVFARGIIADGDKFDAEFFGINPAEARATDPQQRVFLELAVEALENAGYAPDTYPGLIGVYAGMGNNYYYGLNVSTHPDLVRMVGPFPIMVGNEKDHIATRVAHKLNLRGPAVSVHTACSTAMTAIDNAFFSLATHQCDLALAGGISLQTPQYSGQLAEEGGVFAKDGHCRPFDAAADGTMFSDSAGIVVLKRLDEALRDRDTIYAVIKATALNNDGSDKVSYLAPSVNGQKRVVAMALARAGVSADTIGYIEAHGTATPIGDPIEVEALSQVFRRDTDRRQFCGIGSIKSNLGHPTIAAGVTGVIKAALALANEQIPATLHYEKPNPKIDFESSPFYVVSKLTPWPRGEAVRRAGVSAFGFGGTNGHAILEEAPVKAPAGPSRPRQLLLLSAKTASALDRMGAKLAKFLEEHPQVSLADAAFTLQVGRTHHAHRRFVVAGDHARAAALLRAPERATCGARLVDTSAPEVVFLFPGQGSQYLGMGRAFYATEPSFRDAVDTCAELLRPSLGCDLREILYPETADESAALRLQNTRYQQPAIFTIEYALSRLWASWGVVPDAMIGHSIGEFVAATIASVFTLEDALVLVAERGRMMSELPGGAMLSVRLPAAEIVPRLPPGVSLAASNAPSMCVVAGERSIVAALQASLEKEEVFCKILGTSHAFHSSMMDPIVEPFTALVASKRRSPANLPILSTLTNEWMTPEGMSDPTYWGRHLRSPVRFAEAIEQVLAVPDRVLLEVGPGSQTSALARQQVKDPRTPMPIASLEKNDESEPEWTAIRKAQGELWLSGVALPWLLQWEDEARGRIPLPTYAFAKTRHWVDPAFDAFGAAAAAEPAKRHPDAKRPSNEPTEAAQPQRPLPAFSDPVLQSLVNILEGISGTELGAGFDTSRTFANMGLDSLFLTQISYMVKKELNVAVSFRQLTEEATSLAKLAEFVRRHASLHAQAAAPASDVGAVPVSSATSAASDTFPLNSLQREILSLVKAEGADASCAFNESISVTLTGAGFDRDAMERAVAELVARHDALRCVFDGDSGTARVQSNVVVPVPFVELAGDVEHALKLQLKDDFSRPFDLQAGPLVRFHVFRVSPEVHVVALTSHLVVCDMWSLDVLVRDLGALYTAALAGHPDRLGPVASYRQYVDAERDFARTTAYGVMAKYWADRLQKPVEPLTLAEGGANGRSFQGARLDVTVPTDIVRALSRLAGEVGCSLYTVLFAGLSLALAERASRRRVVIGMPVAGQVLADQHHLVGNCLRYLPVVPTLDPNEPLDAFLRDLRADIVGAVENGRLDVGALARASDRASEAVRVPPISVCFNMSPVMEARDLSYGRLGVKYGVNPRYFESFELFINAVADKNDHLEMQFQYKTALFSEEAVRALQGSICDVYRRLGNQPRRSLGDYAELTSDPVSVLPSAGLRPGDHPAYFGRAGELYGLCHIPRTRSGNVGVMFAYPIGQEYIRSFWAFRLLSNQLLAQGVPVFKFDYAGTGDSIGDSASWDVDVWTENLITAAEEFRRKARVAEVSIVSLRFGCVLAAQALERGLRAKTVVLWDPVVSGERFLEALQAMSRELLRQQMTVFPFPTEADLDVDPDELAGFRYGPKLRAAIRQQSLPLRSFSGCDRVVLAVSEDRPEYASLATSLRARQREVEVRVVPDSGHWDDVRLFEAALLPSEILGAIVASLTERHP